MRRRTSLFILVIAIFSFLFGWEASRIALMQYGTPEEKAKVVRLPSPSQKISEVFDGYQFSDVDLGLFWDVWKRVNENYVDAEVLNIDDRVYGAIKGMVASIGDPYTVFMTPDETQEFDQTLSGTLQGIGAELSVKDGNLVVISPLKNSPAEKAGLLPGDIVYKIEGKLTNEMTLFEAVIKIRGQKGTSVTLTVIRKGVSSPFDVIIVRDNIHIESVSWEDEGKGIFYISINQFSDSTKTEFNKVVSDILLKEPKALILDLRFNGGGYLDIAVDILSEFLASDEEAVMIKRRDGERKEVVKVSGASRLKDIPVVVLANNGSASASEIVAGAIQDHKRGIVIGEKTFGKGSVQEVEKLKDGSSLRITIAKWLTPLGRSIDGVGIEPDIKVALTPEDVKKEKDPQLDEALKYVKELIR